MAAKGKGTPLAAQIGKKAAERMFCLFLLWLISKEPSHGYELISRLRKDKEFQKIGPAHIYPYLRKLSNLGLVRAKEKSTGKRVRKLYSITPLGKKKLGELRKNLFRNSIRARFLKEMMA